MMGKFGDTMLPSNISPESLPDKFMRNDPNRRIPINSVEFSGIVYEDFQLVTEDLVKHYFRKCSKSLVTSTPYPLLLYMTVRMNLFP